MLHDLTFDAENDGCGKECKPGCSEDPTTGM